MSDEFKGLIAKVAAGSALSRDEAAVAFDRMMSGEATPSQMGGLLMAMRVRGETVQEILVLVGKVQRRLRVRRAEDQRPYEKPTNATQPRRPASVLGKIAIHAGRRCRHRCQPPTKHGLIVYANVIAESDYGC